MMSMARKLARRNQLAKVMTCTATLTNTKNTLRKVNMKPQGPNKMKIRKRRNLKVRSAKFFFLKVATYFHHIK